MKEEKIENDSISLSEMTFKFSQWIIFFRSRSKIIFLSGFLGALLGLCYFFYEKPIYVAELTFALEDSKSSGGGGIGSALASSIGIDLNGATGGAFSSVNLTQLMKSRLIIEKVLLSPIKINNKETNLLSYYIEISGLKQKWAKSSRLKNIEFPYHLNRSKFTFLQDSILKNIYKKIINQSSLDIKQKDKKITIFTAQVKNEDEIFAKFFCEKLVKETSNLYIETKSKKAKSNVDVLQKQVDSIKNELNIAIEGVANEVDNVYNLNPAFNIKVTPSKQKQVDVQTNTAIITNLVVQLELAKINLRNETPLIQLIDSPIFPLEVEKYSLFTLLMLGFIVITFLSILILVFYKYYF